MAFNREIHNSLGFSLSLAAAVYTSDQDGTGVDVQGYDAVEALFVFGATGDTLSGSVKVLPVLQESDDNSTFTDVDAADLRGALTVVDDNAKDDTIQKVGYIGSKRYLRTKFDFTGTHSNGIECVGIVVKGLPHRQPVA
jgi:hypothetical protein